jgi:hypothetical protein
MMRKVTANILATTMLVVGANAQDGASDVRDGIPAPIIAQIYAEPEVYERRRVSIYGLVVDATSDGTIFMLQDVSQRPLRVVGGPMMKASAGDQVTIVGTLRIDAEGPYLAATLIVPTQVLAGGGCC